MNIPPDTQPKPLLRGWLHAGAAVAAGVFTLAICWRMLGDPPHLFPMLVFGLSMVWLFAVSAVYHIGAWQPETHRKLRALDHANIFVLIAGTYTPICLNALGGWVRPTILTTIWLLALTGVALSTFTVRLPRWVGTGLYVGMGWVSLLALPALLEALPQEAVLTLFLGGAVYTLGGVVYALKRPDPFPRIFGFHEVFHLLVVIGAALDAVAIWVWVAPIQRS